MDYRRELSMAYQPVGYPPQRRRGLGITALVLGIVALITLVLCGLGVLVAIAGIIIGIIAIVRDNGRGMAVTGLALSVVTLAIAIGAGVWFFTRVSPCTDRAKYPTKADRDHCLEKRVPFFKATETPAPGRP
jgi:ABC-type nickel/cobalt efflux system permease component RcnA